jgi:hypothetical protein
MRVGKLDTIAIVRPLIQSLSVIVFSVLITNCASDAVEVSRVECSPVIATVGDSLFTLDRLNAILRASEDTLGREEIELYLRTWAEDQAFAQAALQASLLDNPLQAEHLNRVRLRFLRGLLEESWLAEPSDPSLRTLKRYYKKHTHDFVIGERQLKFAWYASPDSMHIVEILASLEGNRLRRDQLAVPDFEYGRSEFVEKRHLEPYQSKPLFELDYLGISEILRDGDIYTVYQVVGQRPKGYLLPFDAAEGLVREHFRQSTISEELRMRSKDLLDNLDFMISLDPLYRDDGKGSVEKKQPGPDAAP